VSVTDYRNASIVYWGASCAIYDVISVSCALKYSFTNTENYDTIMGSVDSNDDICLIVNAEI